ncbi:hypothetical protein D3C71_1479140 [compost metagenome]
MLRACCPVTPSMPTDCDPVASSGDVKLQPARPPASSAAVSHRAGLPRRTVENPVLLWRSRMVGSNTWVMLATPWWRQRRGLSRKSGSDSGIFPGDEKEPVRQVQHRFAQEQHNRHGHAQWKYGRRGRIGRKSAGIVVLRAAGRVPLRPLRRIHARVRAGGATRPRKHGRRH